MGYGQGKRYHRKTSIRFDDGSIVDFTLCGRVLNGRDFKIAGIGEEVTCSKCLETISRLVTHDAPGEDDKRRSETQTAANGAMPDPRRHVHIVSHELAQQLSQQSPEAAALAGIALAFCKECLGWKNAHKFNDWGYPYICESVSKDLADTSIPPYERHFHYTHLDKVMEAVRKWLSAVDAYGAEGQYKEIKSLVDYLVGTQDHADVCRDLMAACVEAHRSRTGIRQDA